MKLNCIIFIIYSIYIITRLFLFIYNNSYSIKPTLSLSFSYIPIHSLIYPLIEMFIYFTHPIACRLIQFILMSYIKAIKGLSFIIESVGLAFLLIYLTSIIYFYLQAYQRHIISIIRRFSWVVSSCIRQLYKDFESVQSISGRLTCKILSIIDLITVLILKLWAIL